MADFPKSTILDASGRPIKKQELKTERATPTLAGVRPVIAGHPADGLTPMRMARIHREAAEGDPLAYFEMAEDIEERDLHYLGVLGTRKRSVAQLPITVEAASEAPEHKKHADFVRSWIEEEILQASLFDLLDAIGKGISVLEIDWRYHGGHLCPGEFIYRPQRWFTYDRTDGETLLLREGADGAPLLPHKFVVHRHRAKSGLSVRSGLTRVASWAWMFKSFSAFDWATFCQNYGAPIRVGRYGPNASEEQKDVLWRAVSNIAGDCAAIIPAGMELEFVEVNAKGTSTDLFERRCDWLDRQTSKAVLGQTTTTDAVSGGHAVAKEHRQVQEDIERADAKLASATCNKQIVPNMVAFNFGPQPYYPKVKIGRPDEVPLGEFAEAFEKLGPQGLTASAQWMRGRMGIPDPEPSAELVGGRPALPIAEKPARNTALGRLFASRHTSGPAEQSVDVMTARLQRDAAGALGGLTEAVRTELMAATDLRDAAERLARLQLSTDELTDAMARGMALAHLAGQASLQDDIED